MMRLRYFPVNAAWAFVFGDTGPMRLHGADLFFETKGAAIDAADALGLTVAKDGTVTASTVCAGCDGTGRTRHKCPTYVHSDGYLNRLCGSCNGSGVK